MEQSLILEMADRFPLQAAPICRFCSQTATLGYSDPTLCNGNANRPYYYCESSLHKRKFLTWNDYQGILSQNPHCQCGHLTRRNRKNENPKDEWYACASGHCKFRRNIENGEDAGSMLAELDSSPLNSQPLAARALSPFTR